MKIMNIAGFLPLHITSDFLMLIQRGKVYGERYLPIYKSPFNGSLGSQFGAVVGITSDDLEELYNLLDNEDGDLIFEELTAPNFHNWK